MKLEIAIAQRHLLARKRQSLVSLAGIVLGVAFFLAISSMMRGSEKDFLKRLVDNSPHITIYGEYRAPRVQPLETAYTAGAVEVRRVKPLTETRGIRGFEQILEFLRATIPGIQASPTLTAQALVSAAGRDFGVTLNGMIPEEVRSVTTIDNYIVEGSIDDLIANPSGILIGRKLAKKLSLAMGDNITVAATTGQVRTFKIVGLFQVGRSSYDEEQAFVNLKRVQALLDRPNRANTIIIKLPDPYQSFEVAAGIENRIGYKAVSWQEASEDLLNAITIRNAIMYTVVSAVLVVAAFGIYNVISTVVMEKQRDIAILKSTGFHAHDIRNIFLAQGVMLGIAGSIGGLLLGMVFMQGLMQVRFRPPSFTDVISMPIDWSWPQFTIAVTFAMVAAICAAVLPARKAAKVQPVDILRGGS